MYNCAMYPCVYTYVCPEALFEYCDEGLPQYGPDQKRHPVCKEANWDDYEDPFNCAEREAWRYDGSGYVETRYGDDRPWWWG